ncbi:hypothetical protein HPHPP13_1343 [Helicobacter pylori Hp P-13]|uniref:Uncharacterized protein n=1 Tax=Helicobacter pylori Hp P-13b TaxID=992107 RepID=A0ABC9QQT3_HELPX|nr:hypothetical protein [Helicobacter pylori]EJC06530.1 hypothetical protein HPHPP13_1343 [Helicobacter pylori Hp P-13]EJC31043.1 hypothetical protein HPHPP13B_1322 [Helicobacter pylori Hp P-13b]
MEFNPEEELLNTLEESKDAEYVELCKKAVEAQMELRKVMDKHLEHETKEIRSRMQARITERLVSEILNTEEHFSKKIIQNEKTLEIIFDIERTYENDW